MRSRVLMSLLSIALLQSNLLPAVAQSSDSKERVERVALFPESLFPANLSTHPEHFFDRLAANPKPDTAKVLAIGDSWFAYPHQWPVIEPSAPSNILSNLCYAANDDSNFPVTILSLSNSGEILSNMAGMEGSDVIDQVGAVQREVNVFQTIGQCMRRMKDIGQKFDFVIISGGGNDMLSSARLHNLFGHTMCANPADPLSVIKQSDIDAIFDHILSSYKVLVSYLLASDSKTIVIAHTYDNFFPEPVGASFASTPVTGPLVTVGKGGWFYPVAMTYGVTDHKLQRAVALSLLKNFQDRLVPLSQDPSLGGRFHVVQTQGSMAELAAHDSQPESSYWLNEIHLKPRGYNYVARKLADDMRAAKGLSAVSKYPKMNEGI